MAGFSHLHLDRLFIPAQGLSNFHNSQAFIGGFFALALTYALAFFSYGGIEFVTAARESPRPYKTAPRAIKPAIFRIVIFYILTILAIGLCIAYDVLFPSPFCFVSCFLNIVCSLMLLPPPHHHFRRSRVKLNCSGH